VKACSAIDCVLGPPVPAPVGVVSSGCMLGGEVPNDIDNDLGTCGPNAEDDSDSGIGEGAVLDWGWDEDA
jgi:hypothetical protein